MSIDVKGNLNVGNMEEKYEPIVKRSLFIERQAVDADAAYKRIEIIRRHKREMLAEINATNTVDIVGTHAAHYDNAFVDLDILVMDEEDIIRQGK